MNLNDAYPAITNENYCNKLLNEAIHLDLKKNQQNCLIQSKPTKKEECQRIESLRLFQDRWNSHAYSLNPKKGPQANFLNIQHLQNQNAGNTNYLIILFRQTTGLHQLTHSSFNESGDL